MRTDLLYSAKRWKVSLGFECSWVIIGSLKNSADKRGHLCSAISMIRRHQTQSITEPPWICTTFRLAGRVSNEGSIVFYHSNSATNQELVVVSQLPVRKQVGEENLQLVAILEQKLNALPVSVVLNQQQKKIHN